MEENKKTKFDTTINVGHIITVCAVLLGFSASYVSFKEQTEKQFTITSDMIRENTDRINHLNELLAQKISSSGEVENDKLQSIGERLDSIAKEEQVLQEELNALERGYPEEMGDHNH